MRQMRTCEISEQKFLIGMDFANVNAVRELETPEERTVVDHANANSTRKARARTRTLDRELRYGPS